ncbi:EAL domain-containing protein [Chitinibacter sp. GC72]|uniref:EAL domain-containing response regulator n=1 Tax=Chitinibacter sp. GC72 TaxID=1526917 RepID=UPI0012F97609|nr:EAL domain-containing response regulator [Chitinibacter sp. GC72]
MAANNELLSKSILIVDDSPLQRSFAVEMCQKLGIRLIFQAGNGLEALELLALLKKQPDIMMVDLEMPDMDGVELIQKLQELHYQIPLIIASSREESLISSVSTMITALGQPLLGSLKKPINPAQLLASFNGLSQLQRQPHHKHSPITAQLRQEDLIEAIAHGQIVPFFQPKVDIATGLIKGVEALARWQHPELGLIPPDFFIPLAEKSDQIIRLLTLAIAEQTIRQCAAWNKRSLHLSYAINLSPRLLSSINFFQEITKIPALHGISNEQITWEVTESSVVNNLAAALGTLARLRLKGFGLSIDDYGTGFSSMQQLARIPFTELKIDRSFVNGACQQQNLSIILQSAIDMANRLGMSTVAEGVETLEDWRLLQQFGCEIAQGYFIAKPMPAAELFTWLKGHNQRLSELRAPNHIGKSA